MSIQIFDDILPLGKRSDIYMAARLSKYSIGWADSMDLVKASNKDMHSIFSEEEFASLGLLPYIQDSAIQPFVKNLKIDKVVMNLTRSCDIHYPHTHPEQKVLLYYVNLDWQEGWEGETFFYKHNCKDVETVLPYVPGRFVLFNGATPHSIRAQSSIGPQFRFTLAIAFN